MKKAINLINEHEKHKNSRVIRLTGLQTKEIAFEKDWIIAISTKLNSSPLSVAGSLIHAVKSGEKAFGLNFYETSKREIERIGS